jgi:hypothetical protein
MATANAPVRYSAMEARGRASLLPPSYTITRNVTPNCQDRERGA